MILQQTHPGLHRETVVVIGNGMVGHRFCQRLTELDTQKRYRIITFCEEPRPAYDRVGLSKFFAHRDAAKLELAPAQWYGDNGIELHVGDRAVAVDREAKTVTSHRGMLIAYDVLVLATGSSPFVPPVPGIELPGVFVYRTIEDLEKIIAYSGAVRSAAVIGGGLLGLEAAKATHDLGLQTHVIEFAPRLMPRQVDEAGSRLLVRKIESLGVRVHLNKGSKQVLGKERVEGLAFNEGDPLQVGMVVVSAGIRPRDELARQCGLAVGARGGVAVNDSLQTSDPQIYAIGEVALYKGMVYGLVAPGYEMAEIVAARLCGQERRFQGADLSTKLKLMGVDVASFGDYEAAPERGTPLVLEDPFAGVYKKLVFNREGTRLIGGILVGDASDYGTLLALARSDKPLPMPPAQLLAGKTGSGSPATMALSGDTQVCSCNNVSKEQICAAIKNQKMETLDAVKACTKAGTGCGGCVLLVVDLLHAELKAAGIAVSKSLCEHFAYSRQELFEIIKIAGVRTFDQLLASHGQGHGCEICKPTVASILASLWNEHIVEHSTIQDTNDRFLANVQKGGLYSVVPRVPGGEITPAKLEVLAVLAKKYGLYCKITGGQRIDLLGAQLHQLPEIWEQLIAAGFESGHAYGKALRTVKSCVGTSWCRYGVQDSVGLAIKLEERYKGVRAPHKVKAAVSGCIRECAEAQSKDFGLIATEKGYNLYVGGNGGAKPRHADLLAADLDEATAIKYVDRFLMYYIQTADKLTRTATWLQKLDGGVNYLRQVVVDDKLGIAADLERQMQALVHSYKCEWREVVESPEKRALFRQFVNTDETEVGVEFVSERGQSHPDGWAKNVVPVDQIRLPNGQTIEAQPTWVPVGKVHEFPVDGGATVKYGRTQIAVFHFASRGQWYATQNMCPHKRALTLSHGLIGEASGVPKVACPMHKKTFSLETGSCLSGENYQLETFPVEIRGDEVFLQLPAAQNLEDKMTAPHSRTQVMAATASS